MMTTVCNDFNIKMSCSGGADTTSPVDSDPLGFSVNTKTGAITGTPQRVRDGYQMRLRAVDAADKRATVAAWTFDVKEPPAFGLNASAGWSMETDGKLANKYHVDETHLLPNPRLGTSDLLQHPAGGFDQVVYLLSVKPEENNTICTLVTNGTGAAQSGKFISALTDVATGEGAINIKCEGNYSAKLAVRDGAGKEVDLRSWRFEVLRKDTAVEEYGPGGRPCANGKSVDGEVMDRKFTCDCNATKFVGDNCEVESALSTSGQDDTASYIIGTVFAVIVLAAIVVLLVVKYQRYQWSIMVSLVRCVLHASTEMGALGCICKTRTRIQNKKLNPHCCTFFLRPQTLRHSWSKCGKKAKLTPVKYLAPVCPES